MGNADTKLNFRKAVIQLTTKVQPVDASDDAFWEQFWSENNFTVQDVFALIPAAEIRALREESPSNLATLCYKCVEKLVIASTNGCSTSKEQLMVLNCARMLTRILPYIFEDSDWRGFFWSQLPNTDKGDEDSPVLAQSLLNALSDLLFCPDFTVHSAKRFGPDNPEDLHSLDSCEYIWEAGVGFASAPPRHATHDKNRCELLKLLLTCFSEAMYLSPSSDAHFLHNPWITYFCSSENRHALPLFTSLLNVLCSYDPVGYGIPYNYLMLTDFRGPLVEVCGQLLVVTLDQETSKHGQSTDGQDEEESSVPDNLFVNYLSRIHREEDLRFIVKGLTSLLNNPLTQTYLPHSVKKVYFHQELFVLFWKMCDINKKLLFYVLKSSDVLGFLVPILYHLNDARADQSRVGLMHIGVFILLLLSGERNFGVRLNKPYSIRVPMDIPVFTGTHADLLIIVFHKIITTGHQRLQPLFESMLTIVCNVSPYLKTLSMVTSTKLLHLLEAFSTPWFLVSSPTNHHLVFFLLEVFNNIVQYQFDGNANLIYTIIRKRNVFHQVASLPADTTTIQKALERKQKRSRMSSVLDGPEQSMAGSTPATEAEPGTTTTSLAATPSLEGMVDHTHPSPNAELMGAAAISTTTTTQPSERNHSDPESADDIHSHVAKVERPRHESCHSSSTSSWLPTPDWVAGWKQKLPLQTIMRLLQVLVPQVEKICIDKGLTDESEILKFLQHGTLVGLLPVPHPILIRKYQANAGTAMWFRTYMWGIIYLRNVDPPIWYDTDVKLFEIQRV